MGEGFRLPVHILYLRDFTRQFNTRIQTQIGRDYEWVAIDHHNTSHPHVHLLIRGKDKLELAPDMIRRGMRAASQDILTESLGYRTEREIQAAREREIGQRRFTALDRQILERSTPADKGYGLEIPDTGWKKSRGTEI